MTHPHSPSAVALVRCNDYTDSQVEAAVRRALDLLPELTQAITPDLRLLLKVNLTQLYPLETAVTTHPAVVKALGRALAQRGARVTIGEASGASGYKLWRKARHTLFGKLQDVLQGKSYEELGPIYEHLMNTRSLHDILRPRIAGIAGTEVHTDELGIDTEIDFFIKSGMADAARETGAELEYHDLHEIAYLSSPTARFADQIPVARGVAEADRVVSLAKFKTHEDMIITGAIKNFFGIIPTSLRRTFHSTSKFGGVMGQMLVDVFSVVKPAPFAITDAVMGLEGRGPLEGTPRHMGLIMASCDCVAHDAVQAALMGLDPMDIPVVRVAHEEGLGQGLLKNIEIRGVSIGEARQTDWNLECNNQVRGNRHVRSSG